MPKGFDDLGTEPVSMRHRRAVPLLVALLLALGVLPLRSLAAAEEPSDPWEQFLADRPSLLNQLAPPFVDCFKRRDSAIDPLSPMFHGCIDWHSAVHAAYSHHVVARRTGDQSYLTLAEDQMAPGGVSLAPAEQAYEIVKAQGDGLPVTENPYGFGWFLVLAREREQLTGKTDLRQMAAYAAHELAGYLTSRTAAQARTQILNEAHPNYSWSLLNLDVWARYTNDPVLLSMVRDATLPLFDASLDSSCPATRDRQTTRTGFMPACIMRLATVAHVYGDHARDWVMARLPAEGMNIPPVTAPVNCHAGGLNFSRAFALYQLFHITGDTGYRDNYADLIRYHVGRPDLYIGPSYTGNPGYLCYSHWVAQFGVRAISLSYEPQPATPALPPPAATTGVSIDTAAVEGSTLRVAGRAAFANQLLVQLGTDPSGDADVPATLGQDLTAASAGSTTDGRVRLRWVVAAVPSAPARGPRGGYGWAFCVSSGSCYEVDAWSTGTTSLQAEAEVWRCADPTCAPGGQTLTTIGASAALDPATRTMTASIPTAALDAAPGATLTPVSPVDAPVFTSIGARHRGGDRLSYVGGFAVAGRRVDLAVGAPGQDPTSVAYDTEAVLTDAGTFGRDVTVPPGPATVYVRACLGANNCAYATRPVTL